MKKPATCWDDVDWSQFAEGDQFIGLVCIDIAQNSPEIINVSSPYHPDLLLVVKAMSEDNGPLLSDLDVEYEGDGEEPSNSGLYEMIFEITNVEPEESISFKVIRWKETTARLSLSARPKSDGMTAHDRQKTAVAMGMASDEPTGTLVADGLAIKW